MDWMTLAWEAFQWRLGPEKRHNQLQRTGVAVQKTMKCWTIEVDFAIDFPGIPVPGYPGTRGTSVPKYTLLRRLVPQMGRSGHGGTVVLYPRLWISWTVNTKRVHRRRYSKLGIPTAVRIPNPTREPNVNLLLCHTYYY
eukprot:1691626-Rhodomonas_salina.1